MSEWYTMKTGFNNNNNSSELSVETSCEMSDSYNSFSENLRPLSAMKVPRRLDFNSDDDGIRDETPAPMSPNLPYRRVRALRLFDTPHTPKTLLEKCSTPTHRPLRSKLFPPKLCVADVPAGSSHHLHPPFVDEDSALGRTLPPDELDDSRSLRIIANINPFTPEGQAMTQNNRALSKTPTRWGQSPELPTKRMRDSNISRYSVEFVEQEVIGRGHFGEVSRCVNKLDGCVYALKRSLRPVAGSAAERNALTEVYAHAVLGMHPHVVRYYSAWAEDGHMIIQNEYCDGGSLQQMMEKGPLQESELLLLLEHIADGLAYIHSRQLVHMDVKPGNIFVCRSEQFTAVDSDDGYDDDDAPQQHSHHIYKLGDLGHVTCITSPTVEEGDCRYLPKEVLQEDYTHLTKADIFAFGLTLYEAGGGGPLPKNGQEWQDIRDGKLPKLPNLSREFNELLKKMVHPDPAQRPSAVRLRRHALLHPAGNKSKTQLRRELAAARQKTELLTRTLNDAARYIKILTTGVVGSNQESAKFRTRSARRLHTPRFDSQIVEVIKSVTSPVRIDRRTDRRGKKIKYQT